MAFILSGGISVQITLLNGSARNNGSCAFILNKIKEMFEENQFYAITYDIADMNNG